MPLPAPIKSHMFKRLLLGLASLLFALTLVELLLRLLGLDPRYHVVDDTFGTALRPGARGTYSAEGHATIAINSAGFRDREHAFAKPLGTIRIAVLGDSYAEALQVPVEAAFWHILEKQLAACPALGGKKVEVLNFGVSGFGTGQELLMLKYRVQAYSPDIVLLAFLTGNDITDNSEALSHAPRPYFVHRNGQLVIDTSFAASPAYPFRKLGAQIGAHSRILQLVSRFRGATRPSRPAVGANIFDEPGLNPDVYRLPVDGDWIEAWAITEDLLKALKVTSEAGGARFIIATLTNAIQVYPDPAVREAFRTAHHIEELDQPDNRIRAAGLQAGIPVITLVDRFRTYADAHRTYLHGFANTVWGAGHWNETGHQLAGELLSQDLCDIIEKPGQ